jgi:hypothetical protein
VPLWQVPESEIAPVTDLPRLESLPEPSQKDLKVTIDLALQNQYAYREHVLYHA